MPNWCENYVEVSGDREVMDHFAKSIEDREDGLFMAMLEHVTPVEEKVSNALLEDSSDWYSHNVENYGTKWDVHEVHGEDYNHTDAEGLWTASFETAWSPPEAIFITLAEKLGLRAKLFYIEEGMDFAGVMDTEDEESYHTDEVSEADDIPDSLNHNFDIEGRMEERKEWED